jgi:crotonobetainyl-CoA:carnitine CoA-transferase CaiB-like acyl-CoA transferase
MTAPLSHIRVLDLTRVLAGPWASQILADLGAEVIKVERPGEGDDTRGWGPPFLVNADGSRGDAAYFLSTNRGKMSVLIDMAKPGGQRLIRELAARSDIVMENFKVGGLRKYGLDYDTLKDVNPRLVYCSITGFGQDGPYAQRAGYDFMIQGMGGIMSVTGQPDGTPGAEPMKVGVAFADIFTGLYAVIGIQAALIHRDRTGQGQHIDMALLDCQVAVLANQALNYLVGGRSPTRLGNAHPNIVPYQTFATKDGYIIIAVGTDRQFREFCTIAGVPHLADDPRFTSNRARVENRAVRPHQHDRRGFRGRASRRARPQADAHPTGWHRDAECRQSHPVLREPGGVRPCGPPARSGHRRGARARARLLTGRDRGASSFGRHRLDVAFGLFNPEA